MSMAIGMIPEKAMVNEIFIELNVAPPSTRCLMAILFCNDYYICYKSKRRTKNESNIREDGSHIKLKETL